MLPVEFTIKLILNVVTTSGSKKLILKTNIPDLYLRLVHIQTSLIPMVVGKL